MDIAVHGWYNRGNIGDESYKLSFKQFFAKHNVLFLDKKRADLSYGVLGGGDVITSEYINNVKEYKRKYIFSATLSKPNSDIRIFDKVFLRDNLSIKNAKESGVDAVYAPDFAFLLKPNKENGKNLIKNAFKNKELYSNVCGVILNSHLITNSSYNNHLFENLCYCLSKAFDNNPVSFLFIPFGRDLPWDDRTANSWAANKCKFHNKNSIIYDYLGVQDTLDIISACDFNISTRLHSSIFSCLSEVPFIDITHNHKNSSFLETIKLDKLSIDYNNINSAIISEKIKCIIDQKDAIKKELSLKSAEQKDILLKLSRDFIF